MGIKMQAPENCGGFCYEGVALEMNEDGIISLRHPRSASKLTEGGGNGCR